MTNLEEIEQKLNELKYQIRNTVEGFEETCEEFEIEIHELKFEYQKALAELKESKKEGKWKPMLNHEYWYRDSAGIICNTFYVAHTIDEWRINNTPIFPTKEECERYWHFMDTVKEKSYEFSKEEWENIRVPKYYICYNFPERAFKIDQHLITKALGRIHFKTEEDAQSIIDNFKDELMEYFL